MSSLQEETIIGYRILIVESDVEAADELASLMSELGHIVQIATDAKSALFELDEFEPQLAMLGVSLSDMPGYELASILKGAPQYSARFRHVPIIYVADKGKMLKHRFVGSPDTPVNQYIVKPFNPIEVREKVTKTLRQSLTG